MPAVARLLLLVLAAAISTEAAPSFPKAQQLPFHVPHPVAPSTSGPAGPPAQALRNYQISHPPVVPEKDKTCEKVLLHHAFGNSYYKPAIVAYTPPLGCGSSDKWAAVVFNLTVTSNGTQFDRLGSISLGHVEIWRTSTAEPTATGIVWTALKDVTRFRALLAVPSTLMFEENNPLNERYTGTFDTILSATFYTETPSFPTPVVADTILPLSQRSVAGSQMFSLPGQATTQLMIPHNTAEAVVEVFATGNAAEEFWYTNVVDELSLFVDASGETPAKGPFREVQLLIDDTLAGVVMPFPVLYTGGANPLLWRPLASLRGYDIPSFFIDITPFIPFLTDDNTHDFAFRVVGQGRPDHSINNDWLITGALHLKLDATEPPVRTTGHSLKHTASPMPLITTAGSGTKLVTFSQEAAFVNFQRFRGKGSIEFVDQLSTIETYSMHDDAIKFSDSSSFPIVISTDYSHFPSSFAASIGPYSYDRNLSLPVWMGLKGQTTKSEQSGEAVLVRDKDGQRYTGVSSTNETYSFYDDAGNTYSRTMRTANSSVVSDEISGTLAGAHDTAVLLRRTETAEQTTLDSLLARWPGQPRKT